MLLSTDERQRAERFHFERDRRRFVVGRGLLRTVLGRYLQVSPDCLQFRYGPQGKPALAGGNGLHFNVSHSGELALYAVALEREVGVDIERIASLKEVDDLAERCFSERENIVLRSLPAERRQQAFYTCWTRKEAYLKATGKGLSLPLDQFDVSVLPEEPAALLNTRPVAEEAARWSLASLEPHPDYMAALAVFGRGWQLQCWNFPE